MAAASVHRLRSGAEKGLDAHSDIWLLTRELLDVLRLCVQYKYSNKHYKAPHQALK
jgi:hypothetical protein